MLDTNYLKYYNTIQSKIPKQQIYTDKIHTLVYGTDASFYRLIPKIVVKAHNPQEVQFLIQTASKMNLAITFRAGGTSLSGQAISDSILILTSRDFRKFSVANDHSYISLQPALTGEQANNILKFHGKKIGPDPASINSAMIGGIAANNASGMCCGIEQNSYKTLKSIKLIMADGTKLDTACEISKKDFLKSHKSMMESLQSLVTQTKDDEELSKLINRKYKIKNTCGYSLNALIDFDDIFDILAHLIIGSEGTLAFIEEITYYTVEDYVNKASSLIFFHNMTEACNAVTSLKQNKENNSIVVDAVELMDNKALKSVQNNRGMPSYLKEFDENVTALLIETRAINNDRLWKQIKNIEQSLEEYDTVKGIEFTDKVEEYTLFWKIRKGLFPAVGAMRELGTTVIIEDVAYPIEHLATATLELQSLFEKHGYKEALIFGHALEGNLHFVFTQDFSIESEVQRYDDFMNDITHSVAIKYQGSLKAEHGTGRNMSSFIELEWGKSAYEKMKDIKNIFDPQGILNPDVIINDDPKSHLKNLKPLPKTNEIVDKCIECGFCEPICPSNELSFTPRHRIIANREISRLESIGNEEEANELKEAYVYDGIETCAACSLCATVCPVGINTADLTKYLRAEKISPIQDKIATTIANNFSTTLKMMKFGLGSSNLLHSTIGTTTMSGFTKTLTKVTGLPKWAVSLPKNSSIHRNFTVKSDTKKVIYFPSCISRTMGQSSGSTQDKTLYEITVILLEKAGFEIILPNDLENLCCGMPFSSKGYTKQGLVKSMQLEEQLTLVSNNGEIPILCDTSPCTKTMLEKFKGNLNIYEPVKFTLDILAEHLTFTQTNEPIAIHSICSTRKMGLDDDFEKLARLCSSDVTIPSDVKCCGFAGDRGFNFPELNSSALRTLKSALKKDIKYAYSTSKTCEIGLSEYSGIDYNSILYLVESCTSPK